MTSTAPANSAPKTVARLLPEQFQFLAKERPTLPFENREDYDRLLAALVAQYDPNTAVDFISIKELADCQWELLRLRRMKKAAYLVEMRGAGWKLMERTFKTHAEELRLTQEKETLEEVVLIGLQHQSLERDALKDLQDYAGVTDDMLLYQAFAMNIRTMDALESSLQRVERRRDQLVKMIEDRGRTTAAMSSLCNRSIEGGKL